jgi:hypothetical protein
MNLLPKIKKCPSCASLNLFRINGIIYKNNFKSLPDWTLKKIIDCRKCKIEFGLFIHNKNKEKEKVVWMELFQCEDFYLDKLTKLQNDKEVCLQKKRNAKYKKTLVEIQNIQNKVRLDKIKVKIKVKMQNQSLFARNI